MPGARAPARNPVRLPSGIDLATRNAIFKAFNRGRWRAIQDPIVAVTRPYLRYLAILDSRTSDICHHLHGTIRPTDDGWWQTHWPPMHFHCRSVVVPISRSTANRRGITPERRLPEVDVHEGFGRPPDSEPARQEPAERRSVRITEIAREKVRDPRPATKPPSQPVQAKPEEQKPRTVQEAMRGLTGSAQSEGPANNVEAEMMAGLLDSGLREFASKRGIVVAVTDDVRAPPPVPPGTPASERLRGVRVNRDDNYVFTNAVGYYADDIAVLRMSKRVQDYAPFAIGIELRDTDTTQRSDSGRPTTVPYGSGVLAKTPEEAARFTAIHEFGHAVHLYDGDPNEYRRVDQIVQFGYHRPANGGNAARQAVTQYGDENRREYFAESFALYHFSDKTREWLWHNSPVAYRMVAAVLNARGMPLKPREATPSRAESRPSGEAPR